MPPHRLAIAGPNHVAISRGRRLARPPAIGPAHAGDPRDTTNSTTSAAYTARIPRAPSQPRSAHPDRAPRRRRIAAPCHSLQAKYHAAARHKNAGRWFRNPHSCSIA